MEIEKLRHTKTLWLTITTSVNQYLVTCTNHINQYMFFPGGNSTIVSNTLGMITDYHLNGPTAFREKGQLIFPYLLGTQNSETGKFVDPLLYKFPTPYGTIHQEYLEWQSTYYALLCIEKAGVISHFRLSFLDSIIQGEDSLIEWVQSLNWEKPWRVSNNVMFFLFFLRSKSLNLPESTVGLYFEVIFNWLDKHQDSRTGLWSSGNNYKCQWEGMGATYHFLPFYNLYNRPIFHMGQIQKSVIDLQQSDGLFHIEGGGGACSDMDAVDILLRVSKCGFGENAQISQTLSKMLCGLLDCQQDDGGFSEKTKEFCNSNHRHKNTIMYGRWPAMTYRICQSDLWSTVCRLKTLASIMKYMGEPGINWFDFDICGC